MKLTEFLALAGLSAPTRPATPSVGHPSSGDEGTGVLATVPGEYWYYQVIQEFHAVLAAGGLTPDATVLTQLRDAMYKLFSRRSPGKIHYSASGYALTRTLACDGAAVSRTTYADLFYELHTRHAFTAQTFTVSIASPAVFTKTGHGLYDGQRIRPSTSGALPTGLSTSVDYFVRVIDADTYSVSATKDGALVNTSGSQSGTHTYMQSLYGLGNGSTTFNLPDLTDLFIGGNSTEHPVGAWVKGSAITIDVVEASNPVPHGLSTNTVSGDSSRKLVGADKADISLYPGVYINSSGTAGAVLMADSSYQNFGVSRPNSVRMLACIEY